MDLKKKETSIMFLEVLIAASGAWNESVANGTKRWETDQSEPINRKMNRADQTWSRPRKTYPSDYFQLLKY